jgi:hypothetical protein
VRPDDIAPAITRIQMLAAGADTEEEIRALQDAFVELDDAVSQRRLCRALADGIVEKSPVGAHLHVRDRDDLLALGVVQAVEIMPAAAVDVVVAQLPEDVLPEVNASLLVFWNHACEQEAARAIRWTRTPEHAPTDAP